MPLYRRTSRRLSLTLTAACVLVAVVGKPVTAVVLVFCDDSRENVYAVDEQVEVARQISPNTMLSCATDFTTLASFNMNFKHLVKYCNVNFIVVYRVPAVGSRKVEKRFPAAGIFKNPDSLGGLAAGCLARPTT